MTDAKHTPARRQWTYIPAESWTDSISGERRHRGHGVLEDGKGFIASLNFGHMDAASTGRKMAAADDMLAAMQRIEPFIDAIVCYASTCGEYEPNDIVREFRAAIAKATGSAS